MADYIINASKARSEFMRMMDGELAYNMDYLAELVEVTDEYGQPVAVHEPRFDIQCASCWSSTGIETDMVTEWCDYCDGEREDCPQCLGRGNWLVCPVCETEC